MITAACVIVGAGAGKRFGEPKAGAMLPSGERFVDRIAALAREAAIDHVVAVLPPSIAPPPGVRAVFNAHPEGEQIESVRLGLAQLTGTPATGALIWPVDHPLVQVDSIVAILDAAHGSTAPIILPTHNGRRGHPVWFARDLWRELVTVKPGGARSVVHAHASDVMPVALSDAGILRNIDVREDMLR